MGFGSLHSSMRIACYREQTPSYQMHVTLINILNHSPFENLFMTANAPASS